ncbi:MAG: hypothetical protein GWN84_16100 [Gammaproteobacteria bacterium]|nr:hypothetical protein [Gammaproteobacteria bacterium]NIR84312.1 hypothetical protein [Gammaproteobacteria bacterium]NIR89827.1 hypothetical protein [Gammaproteobacteria bacterium]NIU05694.1 hypothetical protein [Gammaproteobacteria bacterium]NIV52454.1 hypothetical protein [Gammaproteobacteria bacterium]
MARQLDVQYVVRGSVHKAGDRVRIHAQLIEAASRARFWAERYDHEYRDIFAVQDEMVGTIAEPEADGAVAGCRPAATRDERLRVTEIEEKPTKNKENGRLRMSARPEEDVSCWSSN